MSDLFDLLDTQNQELREEVQRLLTENAKLKEQLKTETAALDYACKKFEKYYLENLRMKAVVDAARDQNEGVKEVLEAETNENLAERARRGITDPNINIISGRWAVNAAMYRLSYSAEKVQKALKALDETGKGSAG